MKDKASHSNCKSINPMEVEVRIGVIMIKEDTKAGLDPTMCTEVIQEIIKIIGAEQDIILIIEVLFINLCLALQSSFE